MMVVRNRFILLLAVGAVLAVVSLSLQLWHLIPITSVGEGPNFSKIRKRPIPVLPTEPLEPDPIQETYAYCNVPNSTDHGREGHSRADYKLLSVQVLIRHGDRYPLYSIPKTKRPSIDCMLKPKRKPSHHLLASFISHMALGKRGQWDLALNNLPRLPNHSMCEMGELTQTGIVQHLRNGEHLRDTYMRHHQLFSSGWTRRQLYFETTGKSRTLQSGLALLYGLLPDFDWSKLRVRYQSSSLFCGNACDCPARNRYLEEEQRRQYRLRTGNVELERTYKEMALALGVAPKVLRAANPVDSLQCHLCHNLRFPCAQNGCLSSLHLATIKRQQLEDEREKQRVGLYQRYAILAAHPFLNRTATRMQRQNGVALAIYSAHDITLAPVLSALGLGHKRFPRFAARLVFENWASPEGNTFVRVLYNGEDVTLETAFCHDHQLLCPLSSFVTFVGRNMFAKLNATSYHEACNKKPL